MKLCNEKKSITCDSKKCPNNNNSFSYLHYQIYLPTQILEELIPKMLIVYLFTYLCAYLPYPTFIYTYLWLTNKTFVWEIHFCIQFLDVLYKDFLRVLKVAHCGYIFILFDWTLKNETFLSLFFWEFYAI